METKPKLQLCFLAWYQKVKEKFTFSTVLPLFYALSSTVLISLLYVHFKIWSFVYHKEDISDDNIALEIWPIGNLIDDFMKVELALHFLT